MAYDFDTTIPQGADIKVTSNLAGVVYDSPYTGKKWYWATKGQEIEIPLFEIYMMNVNHPRYFEENFLSIPDKSVLTGNATYDAIVEQKDIFSFFESIPIMDAEKILMTSSDENKAVYLNVARLLFAYAKIPQADLRWLKILMVGNKLNEPLMV